MSDVYKAKYHQLLSEHEEYQNQANKEIAKLRERLKFLLENEVTILRSRGAYKFVWRNGLTGRETPWLYDLDLAFSDAAGRVEQQGESDD